MTAGSICQQDALTFARGSGGALLFADDDLKVAYERAPGFGDRAGLLSDGANHFAEPEGVGDDAAREFVAAPVGQFDHHLAGRDGYLVGEFRRQRLAAVPRRDLGEEFLKMSREEKELCGVVVLGHDEAKILTPANAKAVVLFPARSFAHEITAIW